LPNVRLLADNYAKAGFFTYVPELHRGGFLPIAFLQDIEPPLPMPEKLGVLERGTKTAMVSAFTEATSSGTPLPFLVG